MPEPGPGGRWVKLELFGGECPIPRQRYHYGLLTLLTFCRWMLSRPLKPLVTAFSHSVLMSIAAYNEAFNSPLEFDVKFNGFLVSREDMACKLPTAAPELAELHDRIAGQAILRFEKTGTTHRARQAIARHLQDGTPLRSDIASELKLGDHTFQRRLAEEGTSFTDLVDDTRRELAQHHLTDPRMTFAEIAYLLGYADQGTFFRASHRWFGEPPGEYRARVLEGRRQELEAARSGWIGAGKCCKPPIRYHQLADYAFGSNPPYEEARVMKATLSQEEYRELKDFLHFYSSRYMPTDSLPPDLRPIACLESLEGESPAKAREGLRQAVNDIVASTRCIAAAELAKIDAELRRNGIITLSGVRRRVSKDLARVLRNNKISNETEYYVVRGMVDDALDFDQEERETMLKMIESFERKAVAHSPKTTSR